MGLKLKSLLWQCIPSLWASQIGLLFGMMIGWPCPAYPYLLKENSVIPLSLDQTAMVAGFLMIGASLASPFSSRYGCGTKYGIISGLTCNLIGWIIVLFGNTIYNLLGGRLIIGLGFGYGQGQVKKYIKDLCEPNRANVFLKLFNLYTGLGIVLTFLIGCFCDYYHLVLTCTIISSVILFISLFLPHTPLEYLQLGKEKYAVKVLMNVKARGDVFYDLEALKSIKDVRNSEDTLSSILKQKHLRTNFALVCLLTFLQQFSGLPATIVYCKIIFDKLNLSQPEIYAVIYAILILIENAVVIFYLNNVNKKIMLLISALFVSLTMISLIFIIYYEYYINYSFLSVLIMFLYQFFHTIGLGSVTPTLINDYFPPKSRNVIANYHLIVFCISALLITKIFQVLYERYPFAVPFSMFFVVSIITFIFIAIFIPYNRNVNV